jgi:hypothetical protein
MHSKPPPLGDTARGCRQPQYGGENLEGSRYAALEGADGRRAEPGPATWERFLRALRDALGAWST